MPKERSINPVAAQHKADKRASIKKNKAQHQAQRNERLSKRNPDRLERQVEELKALESSGQLRPKDKEHLEHLERELKAVQRAREALGDKAPVFKPRRWDHDNGDQGDRKDSNTLGKRRREYGSTGDGQDESETEDEARNIPMPRDTPPPIPRRQNARTENTDSGKREKKPAAPAQTTYSAQPQLRDLGKEATRFVPSAVASKIAKTNPGPANKLLEPEELDELEAAGYGAARRAADEAEKEAEYDLMARQAAGQRIEGKDVDGVLHQVEVEDVLDEEA